MDEVSRRSGVSKTTIYRHWPSRNALLLDACSRLGAAAEPPDTGSLKGDLLSMLTSLAVQLRDAPWSTVLPSIIDAAERDPELAKVHAALQATFGAPFLSVAERAKAREELTASLPSSELVASVLGPLYYRRWFSKEPVDANFITRLVDRAVG